MDKMDKFAFGEDINYEDIHELESLALKRMQVMKLSLEHFFTIDEFDEDEMFFYVLCKKWFYGSQKQKPLTKKQKKVLFYYLIQEFSVDDISILLNTSKSSVYDVIKRAFKKSQALFSRRKP